MHHHHHHLNNDNDNDNDNDYDNDNDNDDDDDDVHHVTRITAFNRYLYQDRFFERNYNIVNVYDEGDDEDDDEDDFIYDIRIRPNFDDTLSEDSIYSLTYFEMRQLRKSRQIALHLFGRMIFREMLFSMSVEFRGDVQHSNFVIPKDQWNNLLYNQQSMYNDTVNISMYEFVIRRGSEISPNHEINMFGFINDIRLVNVESNNPERDNDDEYDNDDNSRDDEFNHWWENLHEYAFAVNVFSPSEYYPCGSYDMTEGLFSPVEMVIPFSQIRRLYNIRAYERINYRMEWN